MRPPCTVTSNMLNITNTLNVIDNITNNSVITENITTTHSLTNIPPLPGSATIVSIWFELDRSKHGNGAYIEWSKKLCQVHADMYFW